MESLAAFRRRLGRASELLTLVGGYAVFCSAMLISVDIVLRKFAAMSIRGSDELSGYALAVGTAWALSYAFVHKSHIRIDILRRFASPRTRGVMDIFAATMLFLAAALLCFYGARELAESIRFQTVANTPLRAPLWLPQSLWVSGLLMFALVTGFSVVESVLRFVMGNHEGVAEVIGMPGEGEEV